MKLRFVDRFPTLSSLVLGLGVAFSASMVLSTSLLLAGGKQSDVDRGENPVVGSLPCIADNTLDLIFWEGDGAEDPGFNVAIYPVTLGMCASDIGDYVVDANGTPFGRLSHRNDWRILGLQREGWATYNSADLLNGEVSVWAWVPQAYLGGELVMNSPFGSATVNLAPDAHELPVADIAALAQGAATVSTFRITPPAWSPVPVVEMQVMTMGSLVTVEYL